MQDLPVKVKVTFDPKTIPGLEDRLYRILWAAISLSHIRSQYFTDQVADAVKRINDRNPQTFVEFMRVIEASPLREFGRREKNPHKNYQWGYPEMEMNAPWWLRVWQRIQDGDIELVQVERS